MITIQPLYEWQALQVFEDREVECRECDGTGECECCSRDCLACGGSGMGGIETLSQVEIEARYFHEVIETLQRLCAFSSRHDFLDEAGAFIKRYGRPGSMRNSVIH